MKPFICTILVAAAIASAASTSAVNYLDKPAAWFSSDEAAKVAGNILSWQAPEGGWPSNVDTAAGTCPDPSKIRSTFDNKSTTDELRYLARMYSATKEQRYRDAFDKGLDYVLNAQYSNGGWPQSYPPGKDYSRYITFNDGAMGRLMFFVKEVGNDELYAFVDEVRRQKCKDAFTRGVDCILECQIKVDGKLTAWCAQHDEKDFSPRPARAFELVSLSGSESVGLCHVLMSIEQPSPEVIAAVDGAVAWLDSARIRDIRVEDRPNKDSPKGFDRFVVDDANAPDLWARFYEIGTNKPIFCDRDGVAKYKLSEIGAERRNGYRWLGQFPAKLIAEEYPAWKAKVSASHAAR